MSPVLQLLGLAPNELFVSFVDEGRGFDPFANPRPTKLTTCDLPQLVVDQNESIVEALRVAFAVPM